MTDAAREHELKCWPQEFRAIKRGEKGFEYRLDDRGFESGDVLRLREWAQDTGYSGDELRRKVTYILRGGFGVPSGFAVLSIAQPTTPSPERVERIARIIDLTAFEPMTGHIPLGRQGAALAKAAQIAALDQRPEPSAAGEVEESALKRADLALMAFYRGQGGWIGDKAAREQTMVVVRALGLNQPAQIGGDS